MSLKFLKNYWKKMLLQLVVGVMIGTSCAGIILFSSNIAYGDETEFPSGRGFNWADVFGGSANGQNLYLLVKSMKQDQPEQAAIRDMAKSFGYTAQEVVALRGGSLIPLLGSDRYGTHFTQAEALAVLEDFNEQYNFLHDLYQVKADVELSIMPGELFANGSIHDSGFDLIYDLERIEEVLFGEVSERTIYNSKLPYSSSNSANTSNSDDDQSSFGSGTNLNNGLGVSSTVQDNVITTTIGDSTIDIEMLEIDVCTLPDDENNIPGDVVDLGDFEIDFDDFDFGGGFGDFDDLGIPDIFDTDGEIIPAKADDWSKEWCPGILANAGGGATSFGKTGFSSPGNWYNKGDFDINASAFAGAQTSGQRFEAHVALCLNITTVKDRMQLLGEVDNGCVLCNIKAINATMDQVLSHSLMPNKVTGNWGESAKCKTAYSVPVVDMNFITVAAPIPTQLNDDLIFQRNIFEEFKMFTDTYKTVLWSDLGLQQQVDVAASYFDERNVNTQNELWHEATREANTIKAKAQKELDKRVKADDTINLNAYAATLADQLRQMNSYFEGYNSIFNEIGDLCTEVRDKDYIT